MSNLVQNISAQTPPLVVATHVSFSLLQAISLLLLARARGWSYVFLNFVCAGFWAGIMWFIREVAEMKKMELEAERLRKLRIERDKRENDRESAWFAQQVDEMRGTDPVLDKESRDNDRTEIAGGKKDR